MSEIIQKIIAKTGLSEEEVNKRVLEKQRELSGLVSLDGAAYIVAKELGLDLIERAFKRTEIKSISPGIRNLSLVGRVTKVFEPREFEREGKKSKVASIFLADSSGSMRMSLWDDQTLLTERLKAGMAVEVYGAYTRDNRGETELRLSRRGGIKILEKTDLPQLEELEKIAETEERTNLADAKEGSVCEVRAALLQLFESEIFYEICPQCGKRVRQPDLKCVEHGAVQPQYAMVLSGVIDDGSANTRAVFFREMAEKVLGLKTQEALLQKTHIFDRVEELLGNEFVFRGRIRRNQMFDRQEFIVSDVKPVAVKDEINKLINSFGKN